MAEQKQKRVVRLYGMQGPDGRWAAGAWINSGPEDIYDWTADWPCAAHLIQQFIVEFELPPYREPEVVQGRVVSE